MISQVCFCFVPAQQVLWASWVCYGSALDDDADHEPILYWGLQQSVSEY